MPRIYVGTYAKYNNGSIAGAWLDLEDYNSRFDFMQACAVLHFDEHDPELMFQDWEDIPGKFIGESHLSDDVYPMWVDLDEVTREVCRVYWDGVDPEATVDEVLDRAAGTFPSLDEWAYEYLESTGALSEVPEHLRNYIDFEAYARDAGLGGDMTFVPVGSEVWAFRNN